MVDQSEHKQRLSLSCSSQIDICRRINSTENVFACAKFSQPVQPDEHYPLRLSANSFVTLKIYDILGREVATLVNERQTFGSHSITFNAGSLPSGVYIYKLEAGTFTAAKKLLLLK